MQKHWLNTLKDKTNLYGAAQLILDIYEVWEINPQETWLEVPLRVSYKRFSSVPEKIYEPEHRKQVTKILSSKGIITDHKYQSSNIPDYNENLLCTIETKKLKKAYKIAHSINENTFWEIIHPDVKQAAERLFDTENYAQSVFEGCKRFIGTVKKICENKLDQRTDGTPLMEQAFAIKQKSPIIQVADDTTSTTGKDIQNGYQALARGLVLAIKNPKSHSEVMINRERAIHMLHLISLMMYKVDERIK